MTDTTTPQAQPAASVDAMPLSDSERSELMALREFAAGRCTIQKAQELLGPMSLWSKAGLDAEIARRTAALQAENDKLRAFVQSLVDAYASEEGMSSPKELARDAWNLVNAIDAASAATGATQS